MLRFIMGNRRFLRFWMSTWASELGDWIRNMTMMYIVLELSNGSAVAFSMMMFSEFAPIFFFGFLVGAFVDRWNRRRTVLGAIAFRSLMLVFLITAVLIHSLPMLYAGSFVSAIGTLFFRGATPAFTMQFVPEEDRKTAANLRQMSISAMLLLGSPIGTMLYMQLGAARTLGLTVILYGLAWLLVYSIRVGNGELAETETEAKDTNLANKVKEGSAGFAKRGTVRSLLRDIREGFSYAWRTRMLRPLLFSNVFLGYGAGLINVMEVFIITEYLGLPKEVMAVMATVQGGSMLLSTFVVGRLQLALDRFISYGMVIMGIGLGSMVLFPSFYVTAVALGVFSLGQVGFNLGMSTLMQTQIDFEYQGRSIMTVQTIFNGFMVLAMLTSGWLHAAFTVRPVVIGGGVTIAAGGVICFVMFLRALAAKSQQTQLTA